MGASGSGDEQQERSLLAGGERSDSRGRGMSGRIRLVQMPAALASAYLVPGAGDAKAAFPAAFQRQIDGVGRCQRHGSDDPGEVKLAHGSLLKGTGERTLGVPIEGDEQNPAGPFVQAMDEVRRSFAERLLQRIPVARAARPVGKQRYVRGLVEDEKIVAPVEYVDCRGHFRLGDYLRWVVAGLGRKVTYVS